MEAMSVELRYLTYSALLVLLLWIPYVLAQMHRIGFVATLAYPDEPPPPPLWAQRLKRAHYNLVENIVPFAIVVFAGELLGVQTALTAACATGFFWARLLHPIAQVTRLWGTRSATFGAGWAATLVYLVAVLTATA